MPGISAFQAHSQRYEAWFARHEAAYLSELLPGRGRGSFVVVLACKEL